MDPLAELQKALRPELVNIASLYVVALQVLKRALPRIDTSKPLPAILAWTLFGLNFLAGFGLALGWHWMHHTPHHPPHDLLEQWWVQGPLLTAYCMTLYHAARWAFGSGSISPIPGRPGE